MNTAVMNDRLKKRMIEVNEQIKTLDFIVSIDKIDYRLYRMKRKTLMYELKLIEDKIEDIIYGLAIDKICDDLNLKIDRA